MDFNARIKRAHLRSAIFSMLIAILNIGISAVIYFGNIETFIPIAVNLGLGIFCTYLSFNSFKKWKEL